jgi:hypothetical protein
LRLATCDSSERIENREGHDKAKMSTVNKSLNTVSLRALGIHTPYM